MMRSSGFGFGVAGLSKEAAGDASSLVVIDRPLRRLLAFTGRTIDDVVNNPIARSEVRGYFKLHKQIQRSFDTRDLERQWNSIA